jgi:uncharacterized DUF497 family protein
MFDWDEDKARVNASKHGITFDEAAEVLTDPHAAQESDLRSAEPRLRVTGTSGRGRLLVVVVSEGGRRPRIISARRATKRERHAYEARP